MESLACGTPVIASKVGGLPTIVIDGKNGLLVSWRCPQEFAEKIFLLLNDDNLRLKLSQNARNTVIQMSWNNITNKIIAIYEDCLKNS